MKLHEIEVTVCALLSVAWIGCDHAGDIESEPACPRCVVESAENDPLPLEAARGIQNRADVAFNALDGSVGAGDRKIRFESRIGPQPWPRDLPENWPRPKGASVLADTKARDDGRLLLIDLSVPIDQALDSYQGELRKSGFDVVRAERTAGGSTLRASRGRTEASLHFFAREDSTRLEILFVAQ